MTRTPLATVLIPAKDESRWLRGCLESVARQDYPSHMIEVVVVVDVFEQRRHRRRRQGVLRRPGVRTERGRA